MLFHSLTIGFLYVTNVFVAAARKILLNFPIYRYSGFSTFDASWLIFLLRTSHVPYAGSTRSLLATNDKTTQTFRCRRTPLIWTSTLYKLRQTFYPHVCYDLARFAKPVDQVNIIDWSIDKRTTRQDENNQSSRVMCFLFVIVTDLLAAVLARL